MLQEWFILLEGKQEGPFTAVELKRHPLVTPDTLVWKQGFAGWVAIRYVPELEEVFKDDPESLPIEERMKPKTKVFEDLNQEQETLTLQQDPFQFFLWLFVIGLILLYFFFQLYQR